MLAYIAKRLLLALPTLILASFLVFAVLRLIPGDPAMMVVGDVQDPSVLEAVRERLGVDRPFWVQYGIWVGDLLRLDFGHSISTGQAVLPLILDRFGVTAQLVLAAVLLASLIGVPAGLVAAWRHNSALDLGITLTAIVLLSVPSFWVALMLILIFGVTLGWLPTVGYVSPFAQPGLGLAFLVMPVVSLALVVLGQVARMMRSSALDALAMDYVTHARAKGLPEFRVLARHVFPNAFAPTLTLIGVVTGTLLGGAAVIETVFTLPGVGRLLVDSIYARDYPVIQGVVLVVGAAFVTVNLLVDVLYPVFDPRVEL